jgi:hypothetical protein
MTVYFETAASQNGTCTYQSHHLQMILFHGCSVIIDKSDQMYSFIEGTSKSLKAFFAV